MLLLSDELTLWCSCCVTGMSAGLAVAEACSLSPSVPATVVAEIEASSTSALVTPVTLSVAAVTFFPKLVSGTAVVSGLRSEVSLS